MMDEWLEIKLATGRCSELLRRQLAAHCARPCYDVHNILDEIARLEGLPSRAAPTKPAAPYKNPLLKGLWHKHHFQARFVPKNLMEETKRKSFPVPESVEEFDQNPDWGRLTHKAILSAFECRSARTALTGEWIVYAPMNGINYYLTLAVHETDDETGDERIYARAKRCLSEFPELEPVLRRDEGI
jgi:hypothetical protein